MQPKEVEAILKPLYDELEKHCESGNVDETVKFYHSQSVMVEKGKKAYYGHKEIAEMLKDFFGKVGPLKFKKCNEVYQGTCDYLILECGYESHGEKGDYHGKLIHIWKKENNHWVIYHEEYEME